MDVGETAERAAHKDSDKRPPGSMYGAGARAFSDACPSTQPLPRHGDNSHMSSTARLSGGAKGCGHLDAVHGGNGSAARWVLTQQAIHHMRGQLCGQGLEVSSGCMHRQAPGVAVHVVQFPACTLCGQACSEKVTEIPDHVVCFPACILCGHACSETVRGAVSGPDGWGSQPSM